MPRLDVETRRRVVLLRKAGYRVRDIKERLMKERIVVINLGTIAHPSILILGVFLQLHESHLSHYHLGTVI